jgi:kynurenine formamidase
MSETVSTRRAPDRPASTLLDLVASDGLVIFDLGRPLFVGMPQSPNHASFQMALARRHGDTVRADGSSAAAEVIVTGAHVGTHIDALSHVSYQDCLYGGERASQAQSGGRFSVHGVETIDPIVRRGVLLDIPAVLGLESCEPGYEITVADLERAVSAQGTEIRSGDVVLVRSGWGVHWGDRERYLGAAIGVPGVGEAGAVWLADHEIFAAGADTIAFEHLAPGQGHALLPAHRVLLVERGIYIVEALDLEGLASAAAFEFVFILSPLKVVGGTGSQVRPIALVARE